MKEQLHKVISQQIEAFRHDDYATAYTFAAKGIKEQFPLAAFEKMVKEGYPIIAKSKEAIFGLTLDDGKKAVVNVRVVNDARESVSYQYLLELDDEKWCIAGVVKMEEKSETI